MMLIEARGRSWYVQTGEYQTFWNEVQRQEWEPETFAVFERYTDRRHSLIDIGAWIGPTVLYGCQNARMAYAFEPDPVAFAELKANLALNQPRLDNVRLFPQAIAPKNVKIRLGTPIRAGDSSASMLARPTRQAWEADAIRLDDFAKAEAIADCNFIKMDIEGGEYQVIPSIVKWLKEFRPTLCLSLHPHQLYWSGLRMFRVVPAWRRAFVARQTAILMDKLTFYRSCWTIHGTLLSRAEIISHAAQLRNIALVLTDRP